MDERKHELQEREVVSKELLNNITRKHEMLRYNCEAMKMRTLAKKDNEYTTEEIALMYPFWHKTNTNQEI